MERASSDLAKMGIEFKVEDFAPKQSPKRRRDKNKPPQSKSNQNRNSTPTPNPNSNPREVSLSKLQNTSTDKKPVEKEAKDVGDLKEALKSALSQNSENKS